MKILNLVYPDKSDIKYKISKFPDGQQNIVLDLSTINLTMDQGISYSNIHKFPIQIKSRLNNWLDLELIVASVASLRKLGVKDIHLYTPYFLGSRSDRKFEEGGNNYLKDVICPIINSLKFESVTVLDSHSFVLEACLNNFKSIDNSDLVKWAYLNILIDGTSDEIPFIVSPDAGASHKIYKLMDKLRKTNTIITCSKERDTNGKLTNIECHIHPSKLEKDIIIIDDICDGGKTFINIAETIKSLRDNYPNTCKNPGKTYLIVTHGIFSNGYTELSKYFDGIYCTNSYKDIIEKDLQKYEGEYDEYDIEIEQLNVF